MNKAQDSVITRKTEMRPESELVNKININKDMDTIILVQGGTLILEESLLSLNFVVNNYVGTIPAVVIDEGSELMMS
jgi:F-box protein 11